MLILAPASAVVKPAAPAGRLIVLAGSVLPCSADLADDREYDQTLAAVAARDADLDGWLASQETEEDDDYSAWLDAHADAMAEDADHLDRVCSGACPW